MNAIELESAIKEICERMKGPLTNVERAWLHADRKEMRAELARLGAGDAAQKG